MFVRYKPQDPALGDPGDWVFEPGRVAVSKAEMVEKRYGGSWQQFTAGVQTGEARARRVLLWHLLTVDHPGFRWEDTPDFAMGDLVVEHTYDELGRLYAEAEAGGAPQDVLAAVAAQKESAPDAPGKVGLAGKARTKTSAGSGSTR